MLIQIQSYGRSKMKEDEEKRPGVKQVRLAGKHSHNKYELYYLINIT